MWLLAWFALLVGIIIGILIAAYAAVKQAETHDYRMTSTGMAEWVRRDEEMGEER